MSNAINTVTEFNNAIEAGPHAWPGGYPVYFITRDGGTLSYNAVKDNAEIIRESIAEQCNDGWQVVACDINWGSDLTCDHTGEKIESAYDSD